MYISNMLVGRPNFVQELMFLYISGNGCKNNIRGERERDNDSLCEFVFWSNPCEAVNCFIITFVFLLCLIDSKNFVWIKGKVKQTRDQIHEKNLFKKKKNICYSYFFTYIWLLPLFLFLLLEYVLNLFVLVSLLYHIV